ncbi:MAG: glucans biosynthesis glucosyltransferase MdoH [Proteobacteria bacterium]|nr:glucans biosynthesis glucosyltransferase MdoH [Pseudomonadota bacterium]
MDQSEATRLDRPEGSILEQIFPTPTLTPPREASAPPVHRGSMIPKAWTGFWPGLKLGLTGKGAAGKVPAAERAPWERAAVLRRRTLLGLVAATGVGAAALLVHAQPMFDHPALRVLQVALFSLLFTWVSAGFYTALMGFYVQVRGDRHGLSLDAGRHQPIRADARTAVIMPICNEQVSTVFAGLRATYESLATTGASRLFDFYILSDTNDPAIRAAELAAWSELRDTLGAGARVYYRWRQRRTHRKAGNVADFCRRWGKNYRYMTVLDADSVMSGECLVTLTRLMEAHPQAGIIQTAPQACGLDTVHARSQQFAGRTTGRLFTTGMQYWQLGESHYWGHNAIIRVEPFMKHCALAALPGTGGLSGGILSHDFVEAALMRRAGYHIWLVPELQGSYEQQPPNLLEELKRDRRWCQGNLMNARLIAEPGLHGVHRAMLATGAMAYVSAPLWMLSVLLGAAVWLMSGGSVPVLQHGLPVEMIALWVATVTMLALPRALGVVGLVLRGEQQRYGGTAALVGGALLEGLLSVLQAPIRMVAHSLFVVVALTGLKLDWKSPPREANAVSWRDAARSLAPISGVVALLLGAAFLFAPAGALWLAPVAVPLLLAIPVVVATGAPLLGAKVRRAGWLVTPEEQATPSVLRHAWRLAEVAAPAPAWDSLVPEQRLLDVVHHAAGSRNTVRGSRGLARLRLVKRLVARRDSLAPADRLRLLSEPLTLMRLRDAEAANSGFGEDALADLEENEARLRA